MELNIEKMAARRVTATTVDWAKFAEKIPAAQKPAFNALKNKTDAHIRKLAALPESLPKIDFANYKAKIAVAGEQILNSSIHFISCNTMINDSSFMALVILQCILESFS